MTRKVVATAYGGPEVLEVVEVPDPEPGPGEVVVEVRAAGVNPADWKSYSGKWGTDPEALPLPLGFEAAGVIREVGEDVDGVDAGDEVIAYPARGAYTERLVVSSEAVVPKPPGLDWIPAGGLLLVGVTAWHALSAVDLQEGDTVLVHGGAGGVGTMLIQLAVHRGGRVLATGRPDNHDYLRGLGAEPVEYGPGLADRVRGLLNDGTLNAAVDAVGTDEALDTSVELVADRGRIATIANAERGHQLGVRVLGGSPGADRGTEVRRAAREPLAELAASGDLKVTIATTYHLADAAAAHRALLDGHIRGKIVLTV